MSKPVTFTIADARRIANTVRKVEGDTGTGYQGWYDFRGDEPRVRIAKTAGATWVKGTWKLLYLWEKKDPAGGAAPVQSTGNPKIRALNLFGDIPTGKWVVCAPSEPGMYVVIAAEC